MRFLFVLIGFAVSGCTVLTSETLEQIAVDEMAPSGVVYALPKGVVNVDLAVDPSTAIFRLSISDAYYVPDDAHKYVLRYRPLPNYEDEIKVQVSSKTFIRNVKSTTEDKTPVAIVNVAKAIAAFGGFEAAEAPTYIPLLSIPLDPTNDDSLGQAHGALNSAIQSYVEAQMSSCDALAAAADKGEAGKGLVKAGNNKIDIWRAHDNEVSVDIEVLEASKKLLLEDEAAAPASCVIPDDPPCNPAEKAKRDKCDDKKEKLTEQCAELPACSRHGPSCSAAQEEQLKKCATENCAERPKCFIPDAKNSTDPCKGTTKREKLTKIGGALTRWQKSQNTTRAQIDKLTNSVTSLEATNKSQDKLCEIYTELSKPDQTPTVSITVKDYREGARAVLRRHDWDPLVEDRGVPETGCEDGICYRPKEPYKIEWAIVTDGQRNGVNTRVVELPNRAALIALDIRRAFFVKKVHEIEFDESGFLTKLRVEKPSELLAVSQLPLSVIDAIAAGLTLRVDFLNTQKNLAQKEAELIKAQASVRPPRPGLESGAQEAAKVYESAPPPPRDAGAAVNTYGARTATSGGAL